MRKSLRFMCIYYGDNRLQRSNSLYIYDRLTKDHPMFTLESDSRYSVVLTTYNTLEKDMGYPLYPIGISPSMPKSLNRLRRAGKSVGKQKQATKIMILEKKWI